MTIIFGQGALAGADLTSGAFHATAAAGEIWRYLRQDRSIAWHPHSDSGFWVVSAYSDVAHVLRDDARYRSAKGNVLDAVLTPGGDTASGLMLPVTDGIRHKIVRGHIMRILERKIGQDLEDQLEVKISALVKSVVNNGSFDFSRLVAEKVPIMAIGTLMDLPEQDWSYLHYQSLESLGPGEKLGQNEIILYFTDLLEGRNLLPEDSFIKLLAAPNGAGQSMVEAELIFNCYSLLLGGDSTVSLTLSSAIKALATDKCQWNALRSGDVSLETTVEELLRWATPAMHICRTANQAHKLSGVSLDMGAIVCAWLLPANFDTEQFERSGELQLARRPNRHLSFGYGPHFCLGARLARIELRAMLKALVQQVARIEVVRDPTPMASNFLRGFTDMPVRFFTQ